jgi:phenylpropionate dioxygenase-like ring-hydroxylating dioxygenase large terminal subunit
MFLMNCWYAAAWSHEVQGNTLLARKLAGKRVVLYRKRDQTVAALADRCSHRFAPLSLGRHEGDTIRCMYHGLLFASDGVCLEHPGRQHVGHGTNVTSFPVQERWKLLWIWLGDPAGADPALIPDCHYQDSAGWECELRYRYFNADYRLILDNLLDFSHLTFVHEKTLGGSAQIATIKPTIIGTDKGVRIERWYLNENAVAPYLSGFETFKGPVDRWNIYELETRGNIFNMDSGSAPAGSGAPQGNRVPNAMQFHATQIVTPEDDKHSHFFWSYAHNFNLGDPAFTTQLTDRIAEGFEEDRLMIEAQQRVIDESGDDKMVYVHFDKGLTIGRDKLAAALAREAARSTVV